MRVLQTVTLVSDDGAFGGPLKVAMNQAEELRHQGHEVVLAAGYRGQASPPAHLQGTSAQLFPVRALWKHGFAGLVSVRFVCWLVRNVRSFDLLHVHAGRDLISLSVMTIARARNVPYVVQTHGMIGHDPRVVARLWDFFATRRLLLRARAVLVLTDQELQSLPLLAPGLHLHRVRNGLAPVQASEGAWAPGGDVLFCARLHPRKRVLAFVQMAGLVHQALPDVRFAIVGPDQGEVAKVHAEVERLGLAGVVRYEGALSYELVSMRLLQAAVYVLPSVDEPFPMSLLEALSLGVPSVCTDSCGISDLLVQHRAARVTDGHPRSLADAVIELLTNDFESARSAQAGKEAVSSLFSIEAVVRDLVCVYAASTR